MNILELESLIGKTIRGVGYDRTDKGYTLVLITGKIPMTFYFSSEAPIALEVETEQ